MRSLFLAAKCFFCLLPICCVMWFWSVLDYSEHPKEIWSKRWKYLSCSCLTLYRNSKTEGQEVTVWLFFEEVFMGNTYCINYETRASLTKWNHRRTGNLSWPLYCVMPPTLFWREIHWIAQEHTTHVKPSSVPMSKAILMLAVNSHEERWYKIIGCGTFILAFPQLY